MWLTDLVTLKKIKKGFSSELKISTTFSLVAMSLGENFYFTAYFGEKKTQNTQKNPLKIFRLTNILYLS